MATTQPAMAVNGSSIGPYEILETLGVGGAGVVARARHRENGAEVALKTVRLPDAHLLQGIRREIHALSRLQHPQIVKILDDGVQHGLPWYAMELIEGFTLREYCRGIWTPESVSTARTVTNLDLLRSSPSTPKGDSAPRGARARKRLDEATLSRILTTMRRLCWPLAYMHGEGLVHRDLKPGNILVRSDGMPVLVDFGISATFAGAVSRDALEVSGTLSGTAAYMSPEQIRREQVDARADLYSFGCMLYEMLTGRPPFKGRGWKRTFEQHMESEPVPPSQLVPGLTGELDELVMRLLRKLRRDRLGYATDVAAFLERLGAQTEPMTGPTPNHYLYRPGFVGRLDVMTSLATCLERLAEGRGGIILITGESGVGKTRLLTEFARLAVDARVEVLTGECPAPLDQRQSASAPLQGLRGPLKAVADHCRAGGIPATDHVLGNRGSVLAGYEPALADLPGQDHYGPVAKLPAGAARERLYDYLTETFFAFSGQRAIVLALDDLQWSDDLTIGWIDFLERSGRLRESQVLIVATMRQEETAGRLREFMKENPDRILHVERLSTHDAVRMSGEMLAMPTERNRLGTYVANQSEGNPFFLAQYLRSAVDQGLLFRDSSGSWRLTDRIDQASSGPQDPQLPVPKAIRELLERRLVLLGPVARFVLEAAAVLGRQSDWTAVERILGLDSLSLLDATTQLTSRDFLHDLGDGRFRFPHDKIRDVAYGAILPEQLKRLHASAAEILEQKPEAEQHGNESAVGHHWEVSGHFIKARYWYLRAAQSALAQYSLGDAEKQYRAYLRLNDAPSIESIQARNQLGEQVLRVMGRPDDALVEHQTAFAEAVQIKERTLQGYCLMGIGLAYVEKSRFLDALASYKKTLLLARSGRSSHLRAVALGRIATVQKRLGFVARAERSYKQSFEILRTGDDRKSTAQMAGNLGLLYQERGNLKEAHKLYLQALDIARETMDRRTEAAILIDIGLLFAEQSEPEALEWYTRALTVAREIGYRRLEAHALLNIAGFHQNEGRVLEARTHFAAARSIQREIQDSRTEGATLFLSALVERRLGLYSTASALLNDAEDRLSACGDVLHLAACACERGHLALATGVDAMPYLLRAEQYAVSLRAKSGGQLGKAVAELRSALQVAADGGSLFRGERVDSLPTGLLAWLVESGELKPAEAGPSVGQRVGTASRPKSTRTTRVRASSA